MSDTLVEKLAKSVYEADSSYDSDDIPWAETQGYARDMSLKIVRAILAAIEAEGYAVVPLVPTAEMVTEGGKVCFGHVGKDDAIECWAAMLSAAPKVTPE